MTAERTSELFQFIGESQKGDIKQEKITSTVVEPVRINVEDETCLMMQQLTSSFFPGKCLCAPNISMNYSIHNYHHTVRY